jgi:hypothetical protein
MTTTSIEDKILMLKNAVYDTVSRTTKCFFKSLKQNVS